MSLLVQWPRSVSGGRRLLDLLLPVQLSCWIVNLNVEAAAHIILQLSGCSPGFDL